MKANAKNEDNKLSTFFKNRISFRAPVTQNPRLFSKSKKAFILFCIGAGCILPGFTSTVYLPALPEIRVALHASSISVTLSTSLFILFQGLAPLIWASLSEHFEVRRPFYIISNFIYFAASLWCCFVDNIWVLVFLRAVQAIGSSAFYSVGAGTITDLWREDKRGHAMGMIFFGQFLGSLVGPVIGGILTRELNWRANFWGCVVVGGLLSILTFLFVTETYFIEEEEVIVFDPNKRRRRGVVGTILLLGAHVEELAATDLVKPGRRQTIVLGKQRNNNNNNNNNNNTSDKTTQEGTNVPSSPSLTDPVSPSLSLSASSHPPLLSSSSSSATGGTVEVEMNEIGDRKNLVNSEDAMLPNVSPNNIQIKFEQARPTEQDKPAAEEELSYSIKNNFTKLSNNNNNTTQQYKKPMYFPFRPLSSLRYSFMALLALAGGIAYGSMYTFQIIIPTYFAEYYGLNSFEIGLTYLGGGIGNMISAVFGVQKRGYSMPEDRITLNALLSTLITIPVGTAIFGWSLKERWHLAIPILGFSIVSFGMSQVMLSCTSYLVDAIPKKSASAAACFNFVRMGMACILSLISDPLRSIGPEWIGMILTFLNIGAFFLFFPVKIKGKEMRKRANVGLED